MGIPLITGLGDVFVNLWAAWRKDKEFQAWVRLGFSTFYSGLISFMATDGFALIHRTPAWIAFGMGLVVSASAILGVLAVSPQGRSLIISLPQPVVTEMGGPPAPNAQLINGQVVTGAPQQPAPKPPKTEGQPSPYSDSSSDYKG